MKLLFKGHDHKYAIEQILLTLFPEERPEYSDEAEGNRTELALHKGDKYYTALCKLNFNNEEYSGIARISAESADELDRNSKEAYVLQRAFYKAYLKTTDVKPEWGSISGVRPTKVFCKELENNNYNYEKTKSSFIKMYDVSNDRIKLLSHTAEYSVNVSHALSDRDVCLYIGIPFCPTRCSYCSFISSEVKKNTKLISPFLECLCKEIEYTSKVLKNLNLNIASIYVGGGTPTTFDAVQLETMLKTVEESFCLNGLKEYTVEAGRPDTITKEKLQVMKKYGVGRVSVNPQTMSDSVLEVIGRKHTAEDIYSALHLVRSVGGFDVNMDLIAGLPTDTVENYKQTIDKVLEIAPENITVHTLSRKKGANLSQSKYAEEDIPDADTVKSMLDYSNRLLFDSGYVPYYLYRQKFMTGGLENTGWTIPNHENIYNVCIMEELCSIVALGAGASTKLIAPGKGRNIRFISAKYPKEYIDSIEDICRNKNKISEFYNEYSIR